MNLQTFLAHHRLTDNPFQAEEARHDPVFERMVDSQPPFHPDFAKILGPLDRPGTSVVFGEKGSGKTAIRLLIDRQIAAHNRQHPDARLLLVAYDDLGPVLQRAADALSRRLGAKEAAKVDRLLAEFRLEDHQDAILSLAVTRLVDALTGLPASSDSESVTPALPLKQAIKSMPRSLRLDAAVLAALYDQPRTGGALSRFQTLLRRLRLGWLPPISLVRITAAVTAVLAVALAAAGYLNDPQPNWPLLGAGVLAAASIALCCVWGWQTLRLWSLCRRIVRNMTTVQRQAQDLRLMLLSLPPRALTDMPWPIGSQSQARYLWTDKLRRILHALGYRGLLVLVDRVDESPMIHGDPQRMRALIWPLLDHKFLQQEGVGVKLLLPIELRYLLQRESPAFFQQARLDKQNLIDRLTWSGVTLYDLCTSRLRACRTENPDAITLTDLFEEDVTRDMLVDALEHMQQPRDAFKFLYAVILEHCRMSSQDQPRPRIPRILLETLRRQQTQRIQDMQRGLAAG